MSYVRLSVTLVDHDHIGWKSWKLIARTISPTSSLFVARRSSTYSQGTWRNFGRKCSFNTYVHNVRLNSVNRESHDLRWRCGCLFIFVGVGASRSHLCDHTAFLLDCVMAFIWICQVDVCFSIVKHRCLVLTLVNEIFRRHVFSPHCALSLGVAGWSWSPLVCLLLRLSYMRCAEINIKIAHQKHP